MQSPMNRSRLTFFVLYSFLPLLAGTLIYLLWRVDTLVAFRWLSMIHMSEIIVAARGLVGSWAPHFPEWFLYNLPDGLWVFAATNAMAAIWLHDRHAGARLWVLLPAILALLSEGGQYTNHLPGTFCVGDVVAYLAGTFLALLVIKTWSTKEENHAV